MSSASTRLRARLALARGAAKVRLIRQPARPTPPFTELVRIETGPAYRALFCAELDAALEDRLATRTAAVEEIESAAERLKALIRHGHHGRAA
ncbi:hypothetical protein NJO91_11375 [Streptomyces microflavus]|uniref:hypothetical protein n=1 Tax=Streptomyces microflavus TaxID=1919 RepID=UPI0029AF3B48|nr:hypothetical protein [Streptomyces microflavus]MDX2403728.1 hypothetical protein [Streptomyces microflavus]